MTKAYLRTLGGGLFGAALLFGAVTASSATTAAEPELICESYTNVSCCCIVDGDRIVDCECVAH